MKRRVIFFAALTWLAVGPGPVCAHPSHLESGSAILVELSNLERHINQLQARLERHWSLEGPVAIEVLQDSQVAFWKEDYARCTRLLLDLVSRSGFEEHPAFAESMDLLGRSFRALGFVHTGDDFRLRALLAPRQPTAAYRDRLASFLEQMKISVEPKVLRKLWSTFITGSQPAFETAEGQLMRYHFARALYRGGDRPGSMVIFRQIEPDHAGHPRAQYFLGVDALHGEDFVAAQSHFNAARETWLAQGAALNDTIDRPTRLVSGHDSQRNRYAVGNAIQLGLARLAVARGQYKAALNHYQQVPWYPSHAEQLYTEVGFVLSKMHRETEVVHLFSELREVAPAGIARERARIKEAMARARDGDFDGAEAEFDTLGEIAEGQLEGLARRPKKDVQASDLTHVRWAIEGDGRDVITLRRAHEVNQTLMTDLRQLQTQLVTQAKVSAFLLPVAQEGQIFHADLTNRLKHLEFHLRGSSIGAKPSEPSSMHHPQHAEIRAGLTRVRRALNKFDKRLMAYRRNYENQIKEMLSREAIAIAALDADSAALNSQMNALDGSIRKAANTELETLVLRAEYGRLDVAYWRKERVSEQIRSNLSSMETELDKLENSVDENEGLPEVRLPERAAPMARTHKARRATPTIQKASPSVALTSAEPSSATALD